MSLLTELEPGNPFARGAHLYQRAVMLLMAGINLDRAERDLDECLKITRQTLGEKHLYVAFVLAELALVVEQRRDEARAEKYYRECVDIVRAQVGLDHPKVAVLVDRFGSLLVRRGKPQEAVRLSEEMLEAHRRRFGAKHKLVANALWAHANILALCRDAEAKENALKEALAIYGPGAEHPSRVHLRIALDLANNYIARRKSLDEAERLMRLALDLAQRLSFKKPFHRSLAQLHLARALMAAGKYNAEVESLLHACRDTCREQLKDSQQTRLLQATFGQLNDYYRGAHLPAQAAEAAFDLAKLRPKDQELLYETAWRLALCIPEVGRSKNRLSPVEEAQRQSYGNAAIDILSQLIASGFPDHDRLSQDARLDPLRPRDDFKRLAADVQAKMQEP